VRVLCERDVCFDDSLLCSDARWYWRTKSSYALEKSSRPRDARCIDQAYGQALRWRWLLPPRSTARSL